MPVPIMNALLAELPRLQAEETLRLAHAVQIGTGNMRKGDRDSALRELRRFTRGAAPTQRVRTPADLRDAAAALGVTLETVKLDG